MRITRASTATRWEETIGYARAVRSGPMILVSGTVAADAEGRPLADDAHGQTREILRILDGVLRDLGSRLDQTLRLRLYYADPAVGPDVTRALREGFPAGLPALTAVRVVGLVDAAFLVEIEADAIVAEWRADPEVAKPNDWDEGGD